jgi:hypothetical protein
MEKLGVEIDDQKTKQAAETQEGSCPVCGAKLEAGGLRCPTHGTEPFEKQPDTGGDGGD